MWRHITTTFATLLCNQLSMLWWSWQQCIVEVNGIVKAFRLLLLCKHAKKRDFPGISTAK